MLERNKILIISFLLLLFSYNALANSVVQKISVLQKGGQNQFIFELSNNTKYNVFSLPDPARIVIDLDNTQNNSKFNKSLWQNTFVKNIRVATNESGVLRIVLDLKKSIKYRSEISNLPNGKEKLAINLPAIVNKKNINLETTKPVVNSDDKSNFFLQGEIMNADGAILVKKSNNSFHFTPTIDKKITKTTVASVVPKPDLPRNLQEKLREIVIVIDPGHGGKDPGVSSVHGVREKDVALNVAKDLRQQLNQEFGIRAVLTRSGDYFLPLKKRLQIARDNKADLFISIHADAYKKNSSIKGVSIFALSANGATSESARWLAEKENISETNKASDKQVLRSVVMDFVQKTTIQNSLEIAKSVLIQLPKVASLHTHRIEQASFVVLKSPNMPSLLIETGFLSDPIEEKNLQDFDYDNNLAGAIKHGITNYFIENPPQGTYLELVTDVTQKRRNTSLMNN